VALTEAPVLQAPDPSQPYTLVTDASGYGMGAVLLQNGKPTAYLSKRFSAAEMNYSVSEQELCATIFALKTWRHYLEGCEGLTIVTDHHPNTFFQGTPVLSRRQSRWYETLQRFNFEWKYEPRHTNVAVPLSRCANLLQAVQEHTQHVLAAFTRAQARAPAAGNTLGVTDTLEKVDITTNKDVPANEIDKPHPADPGAAPKPLGLMSELLPPANLSLLTDLSVAYTRDDQFRDPTFKAALTFHDGYWWKTRSDGSSVIIVPADPNLRGGLIAAHHDTLAHGHMGVKRTLELMQRKFYWKGMVEDIRGFIRSCDSCQRNKPDAPGPKGLLQSLPIPDMPWSSLSFDFITCLPPTNQGHNALLVVVDRLTKMCRLVPCDFTCTAQEVANLLLSKIFSIFGVPDTLLSDRDPRFTSTWFQSWCTSLGIKQCMSSSYHPQIDGQTERMNRVVEDMLRHFVNPRGSDWDTFIHIAQLASNNAFQESTKSTPFFLNFGRHPRVPGSLQSHLPSPPATIVNASGSAHLHEASAILQAAIHRSQTWDTAKQNIAHAQKAQQKYYNKGRKDVCFAVGDQVLYSTKNAGLKTTLCRKLLPKWIGPFTVTKVVNDVAYKLSFPPHLKWHNVIHISSLRKYVPGRNPPPPLPLVIDGELNYEVEQILAHAVCGKRKGKPLYKCLVKWEGYGQEHNSWEPESNLVCTCESLLSPYKAVHGLLSSSAKRG
jgi:hypothetical protein